MEKNTDGKGKRKIKDGTETEKRGEQECRHEIQMQSMMFNYSQQLQCMQYPTAQNPSL